MPVYVARCRLKAHLASHGTFDNCRVFREGAEGASSQPRPFSAFGSYGHLADVRQLGPGQQEFILRGRKGFRFQQEFAKAAKIGGVKGERRTTKVEWRRNDA